MTASPLGNRNAFTFTALLWLVVVAAALYARPLMPIDETRYVTVAWEMHLADHWLVPLLNGEAYHHKPPLLFWIIRLGWLAFGVSETWARLVAPLFGLGALGLTAWLGRLLWPGEQGRAAGNVAPLLLLTAAWWMLFATLSMFDLIMAFFAVLGWIGLTLNLHYRKRWTGILITGLAIGLGVLGKGPVILVYILPPALFAPLWMRRETKPGWLGWYGGVLLSMVIGAAIGLAWALPAAEAGGAAYKQALLWGQTAGRVRDSFAHRRPFWWYLPLLPLLLFPWSLWPPAWRALALWRRAAEPGLRFGLVASLTGLLVFSMISGKQPHYLLPLAPAFMLVLARSLTAEWAAPAKARDAWWLAAAFVLLAAAILALPVGMAALPKLAAKLDLPDWALENLLEIAALLLLGLLAALWLGRRGSFLASLGAMVVPATLLFLAVHLFGFIPARPAYDLAPAGAVIRRGQDEGRPIAYAGDYHGEYQFLGRLEKPLQEIDYAAIPAWLATHPNGWVVARYREEHLDSAPKPVYAQQKRGRMMVIWDAAAPTGNPEFFRQPR
ncbi:glycosyltransferase family 39 protein [Ferrovibrio sp.]|uniref:ArnT family glycosyltransferase n=1 Tax=Ferrovibrio sp. TaxID=1917215 RepID=UPI00261721DA|nr:glycosyltransferase family 39 protein [Ferrovibrio sp.]